MEKSFNDVSRFSDSSCTPALTRSALFHSVGMALKDYWPVLAKQFFSTWCIYETYVAPNILYFISFTFGPGLEKLQ